MTLNSVSCYSSIRNPFERSYTISTKLNNNCLMFLIADRRAFINFAFKLSIFSGVYIYFNELAKQQCLADEFDLSNNFIYLRL